MKHQQGLVMVFALLILMSLTILGVTSVSGSLLQNKMAASMEKQSIAFDAAEAAIAGVVFESENTDLLNAALLDPLSEAIQGNQLDLQNQELSCLDANNWINRTLTTAGLSNGMQHTAAGSYSTNPEVESWSRTAYVAQQSCLGSSNVIGGSNIACQVFMIKGCGQLAGSSVIVANTLNATVFAPASQ